MRGLVLGVVAAAALWLLIAGLDRALGHRLAARHAAADTLQVPAGGDETRTRGVVPIASEALVFRTTPATLAAGTRAPRRAGAHPRTLATFRRLRAYPGAPPRVPHGLTAEEFRGTICNTCHERGGWSPRFSAYVPLAPHPEWTGCLQCHATDAGLMGSTFPGAAPDALCRQCHTAGGRAAAAGTDWQPGPWPQLRPTATDGTPPGIPHDLLLRGNCLACHTGPGAVAEIRTTHPERANCRQCHLAQDDFFFGPAALPAGGWQP
jgi:hypothetical protein